MDRSPVFRGRHLRMQAEKAAQRRLVGEPCFPGHILYVEGCVPEQFLYFKDDMICDHLTRRLAVHLLNDPGQVRSRYAQLVGVKRNLPVRFEMLGNQHDEFEGDVLLVGVRERLLPGGHDLLEMDVEIPEIDAQQVQDGLPAEIGIVAAAPEIDYAAKTQEPHGFAPVQAELEILPHVKKEIGSDLSQPAHNIEKHILVEPEKGHCKIIADITDRHLLQRQDGHQIVPGYPAAHRKNLYYGGPPGTDSPEPFLHVRVMFAGRKGRYVGIYMKTVVHLR